MEQSKKAFNELIELCEDATSNDTVVLELIQKHYDSTNPHFLWSSEFLDLVNRCGQKIRADRNNKYVFIKEFTTELKAYKAKPLKHLCQMHHINGQTRKRELSSEDERSSKRPKSENAKDERARLHIGSSVLLGQVVNPSCTLIPLSLMSEMMTENRICTEGVDGGDSGEGEAKERSMGQEEVEGDQRRNLEKVKLEQKKNKSDIPADDLEALSSYQRVQLMESEAECQSDDVSPGAAERVSNVTSDDIIFRQETEEEIRENRLQKVIDRLETLLKKISDEIQRLQETELTLDDMDQQDSTYTLEDRYKKRFVKVWNRLCRLKDQRPTTGRETERHLHYTGTDYPEINQRISRFVNKFNAFPDYGDIREIIEKCNERNDLGIRKSAIDRLAQNTFTDVGNILQKRRMNDFAENFGCHLTDSVRSCADPARSDWSLRQKLESNGKISKLRLDEVINKFAQKQETEGDDDDDDYDEEEEEEEELEDGKEEDEEDDDKAVMDEMQLIKEMEASDVLDIVDEGEEVESQEEEDDEDSEGESHLTRESEDVVCSDERKIEGTVASALDEGSIVSVGEDVETVKTRRTADEFIHPVEAFVDGAEDEGTLHSSLSAGQSLDSCFPSKESTDLEQPEASSSAGRDGQRDDFILDSGGEEQREPRKSRSQLLTTDVTAVENVKPPHPSDDVICIEEDSLTSSPVKRRRREAPLLLSHLSKMADLSLTAVKLNAPSESVMKKFTRNYHLSPSASSLVPRQPKEQPVGNKTALLSEEDDDVIVVHSGDTLCRSHQENNSIITHAQRGLTAGDEGDKYCILSAVEEQVIKRDMTSSADRCFTQETTTRKRVFSQIVCLDNAQRQIVPTQQTLKGMSDARQQHNGPCVQVRGSGKSRDLTSRSPPQVIAPLHLDVDRISRDIASSVFRNRQKTTTDGDDLSLCRHLQVAVQPPPTGQVPGGLGLKTTPTPCSRRRQNVGKFPESTSERPWQQRPSKLKVKTVSSPKTSTVDRPLKQKNADFSDVIELN